jgi:hypothetical protein
MAAAAVARADGARLAHHPAAARLSPVARKERESGAPGRVERPAGCKRTELLDVGPQQRDTLLTWQGGAGQPKGGTPEVG